MLYKCVDLHVLMQKKQESLSFIPLSYVIPIQTLSYLRTFELRTTVHTNRSARMSAANTDGITDVLAAERSTTWKHHPASTSLCPVRCSAQVRERISSAQRTFFIFIIKYLVAQRLQIN